MQKINEGKITTMLGRAVNLGIITEEEEYEYLDDVRILKYRDDFNQKVINRMTSHELDEIDTIFNKIENILCLKFDKFQKAILKTRMQELLAENFDHQDGETKYYNINGFTYHCKKDAIIKYLLNLINEQGLLNWYEITSKECCQLLNLNPREELALRFDASEEEIKQILPFIDYVDIPYDLDLDAVQTAYILYLFGRDIDVSKLDVYQKANNIEQGLRQIELEINQSR